MTESKYRGARGVAAGAATLTSRLDRLDVWSLGPWVLGIIGVGFLFIFYDILDINVSFIQTCVQLKPGCTPATALGALRLPVLLNLVGYAFGALVLGPVSDLIGRRHMLMITMLVAGLGSLYTALSPGYGNFIASRIVTGVGVGAGLAVVNTAAVITQVGTRTRGRRLEEISP
jgi:putative MFS transporter